MLKKDKKLAKLRRNYKPENLFFYDPDIFLNQIHLMLEKIESYYELIDNIRLLEREASLLEDLYSNTQRVERLIYEFTNGSKQPTNNNQDDLFGELAEDIIDILPSLGSEDVISLTTESDKQLDDLLEDIQEKIYSKSDAVQKVGGDLHLMLIRAY